MGELGVGILGAGWVSTEHIKAYALNPHTRVVGVTGRTAESARARLVETGITDARVYASYEEMLADPAIHAISICTPPHLHPANVVAGAAAGKHMLIEKAAANTPEDLNRMLAAVQKAGVKTVVSFVLHWNPGFLLIKRLLEQGAIGDIFYAEVDYWHNIGPQYKQYAWNIKREIAGSALLSAGIHAVDAIRWFTRDEVVEVSAYSNRRNAEYEYDTNIVGILKFAGGAIGKVSTSFDVQSPYAFNIDLLGTAGTIRDNRIFAREYFTGQTDWAEVPTIRPDSGDVAHHPFEGEINHFVDCILTDAESSLNLADAARTHRICYAMDRSAETGSPVRLDLYGPLP
ncbi:MAG: Gfo/Idh/MocA family oxidoreductase [Chthonomonadales bacterium]|nr:Gfo/Idh/MocA family oxidoreductase [Chthonomonadales bacterium]